MAGFLALMAAAPKYSEQQEYGLLEPPECFAPKINLGFD
jgi:hypothetical protein